MSDKPMFFFAGVYVLMRRSLDNRAYALLIAGALIIPVHTLGGDTLGFQALGYLPRDAALALVPFVLMLYVKAVREESLAWLEPFSRLPSSKGAGRDTTARTALAASCVLCGLLCNFYVPLFPHLCATLLLAEVIRTRRIRPVLR